MKTSFRGVQAKELVCGANLPITGKTELGTEIDLLEAELVLLPPMSGKPGCNA